MTDVSGALAARIEIASVSKEYGAGAGSVPAISSVSLTVEPGQFVSVVGPSGCGKSSLLMCVAGLVPVSRGSIAIDGARVLSPYTELGIVFQDAELLEWRTALANVLLQAEIRHLPTAQYRERARSLLDSVGLRGFHDKYPIELSGGMRQRVALCRALLHDPGMLLMDEPFGALDALTRDQMNLDLQRVWLDRPKTVMFVTHSIEEAVFLADRVIVFTERPARVAADVVIPLPRPRTLAARTTQAFNESVGRIRELFEGMGVLKDLA